MKLANVYIQFKQDPEAVNLLQHLKELNYEIEKLKIERVIRIEGDVKPESLLPLLVNPLYQDYSYESQLNPNDGPIIEIGYKRAVTDPETPSIFDGAKALGVTNLDWARLSNRYQFFGISQDEAEKIIEENIYNPIIQTIIDKKHPWDSLRPHGKPDPIKSIPLNDLCDMALLDLNSKSSWYASLSQLRALQRYEVKIGRPLTDAEIEIVVQSWSDHCYHTTWRSLKLLDKLQSATSEINHPLVVSVFKDNAGGMKFYEDQVILIKGETHNFPSSIATFGGIATKHGGVIRDAIGFGLGGYPIGGSTIMGTMDPRISDSEVPGGALHPRVILLESIRATAYYCNPMGIAMMHPVYRMHSSFPKCLALGHTFGIIPEKYVEKQNPHPGDAVVLFGGRTGRDGIHGATASSAEMTGETISKEAAAVQIGHPITERKFMEAVPILRDMDCLRSITDLGAGGISCAIGEMGAKTGVTIELEKVPLKDQSLAPWEILLSESQERMLAAIPQEKLEQALSILDAYDIEYAVLGHFTETHKLTAWYKGTKAADIDMDFIWRACPIEKIDIKEPVRDLKPVKKTDLVSEKEWKDAMLKVVSHMHCCDQSAAGMQFDTSVQGKTVIGPYGGINGNMPTNVFVSAPILGKPYGAVTTLAFNPFYSEISPSGMARLSMIEAISKAIAVGVKLNDITLCDNYYTPKIRPEVAWDLKDMVETTAELSVMFGTPFISGKDSSSGTFKTDNGELIDVPHTLVVSTLCRMENVRKVVTKEFKASGNQLVIFGSIDSDKLGASVYLDAYGERGEILHDRDNQYANELIENFKFLSKCQDEGIIKSASAIAEGGLFMRLFEASIGSGLGADIDISPYSGNRKDGVLFAEAVGTFLLEVDKDLDVSKVFNGFPCKVIGSVSDSNALSIMENGNRLAAIPVDDLIKAWEKPFKEVVR